MIFRIFFLSLVIFVSCNKKNETENIDEARLLFSQSVELIREYENNIKNAKDILELESISNIFEKKFTDLNFLFPPETDYKLTEQENDSLFKLLKSLNKSKSDRFLEMSCNPTDSVL